MNPILFEDFVAARSVVEGLERLTASTLKFGDVAVKQNERAKQSLVELAAELESYKTKIEAVSGKGSGSKLNGLKDDVSSTTAVYKGYNEVLKRNEEFTKTNGLVVEQMRSRMAQLAAEYGKLDLAQKNDLRRKREIERELKQTTKALSGLIQVTDGATRATNAAERSYDALDKQTKKLRADLKGMTDAFDQNTGELNKNNKAALDMQARIDTNDKALKRMDATMGIHTRNVGNYGSAFKGLAGQLLGFTSLAGGIGIVFSAIKAGVSIVTDMDRYDAALQAVSRDSADFAHSQQFVMGIADKLGLQYGDLIDSYKSLKAATKDTTLEGRNTEKMFTAVATAGAKLQLSSETVQGTLLALTQMISKGKVTAEELRGQLGERLPGALRLMSEALGVSESKLNKMMEQGELIATEVMPKFADSLDKAYGLKQGEKIDNLTASTNRFKNELGGVLQAFNNSTGVTNFFKAVTDGFGHSLKTLKLFIQDGSWTEFLQFVGPNSFANASARRVKTEESRTEFSSMTAGQRKARLELLADDEKNEKLSTDKRREAALLRRQLQIQNLKLESADMKQARRNMLISEKDAIEKNESDIARFQKQAVRKRTAEIIGLEKQLQAKPGDTDTKTKLDLYKKLDAEQKLKDKAVTNRLKSEKGDSSSKALSDSLSRSSATSSGRLEELSGNRSDGLVNEQAYIEQRLKITLDGLNERQAILEKAGKKETDDYLKVLSDKSKAEREYVSAQLQLDLKANKGTTDKSLAGLDRQRGEEDLDDITYTDRRHALVVAGIERERAIIKEANQEKTELFKATDAALDEEQADYISKRLIAVRKAWKDEITATKEGLTEIDREAGEDYQNRLVKINEYYNKARNEIEVAQAGGKINDNEARQQLHLVDINQLQAEITAYREVVATSKQLTNDLIQDRINKLENYIAYSGASEKELAEKRNEIADLEKLKRQSDAKDQMDLTKKVTDNAIEQSDKSHQNVVENAKKEADMRKKLGEVYMEIGNTVVDGLFSIQQKETANRLAELDARQQAELDLAGNNEGAKAAIQKKYDAERKQIQRQQDQQAKEQALFRILIDTSTAVIKTFAEFGFPFGIPLAAAQAALGAVQAGIVAATPTPAYFAGKNIDGITNDNYAGPATISEKGRELWFHDGKTDLVEKPSRINVGRNDVIVPNWLTERMLSDDRAIEGQRMLHSLNAQQLSSEQLRQNKVNYQAAMWKQASQYGSISPDALGRAVAKAIANNPFWSFEVNERGFNVHQHDANTKRTIQRNKQHLGRK